MDNPDHIYWMREALRLARRAWGDTHPNPMVGALLVADNKVISKGYHKQAGSYHAERAALSEIELSDSIKDIATLYVTLEPCSTHGRTPPCTEIILSKGIKNVVLGATDPNPIHQGKGIQLLREAGVKVETGVLEDECTDLNLIFNHCIRKNSPLIALKSAVTLDGKIATMNGKSKWITSGASRLNVMSWRAYFPAIGVGAGTVLSDNPGLTVRDSDVVVKCPTRFIFDRSLRTLEAIDSFQVFNDNWARNTVLVTSSEHSESDLRPYTDKECTLCKLNYSGASFPIDAFRSWCWENRIWGVFIEGGRAVNSSFLNSGGVDYLFIYQAPKLFGSDKAPGMLTDGTVMTPGDAPYLENPRHEVFDQDILTRGHLVYPDKTVQSE